MALIVVEMSLTCNELNQGSPGSGLRPPLLGGVFTLVKMNRTDAKFIRGVKVP